MKSTTEEFSLRLARFQIDLRALIEELRASDSPIRAVVIRAQDLDVLEYLLRDYNDLVVADARRREQLAAARERARGRTGRKLQGVEPAPSTIRARKSRAAKKREALGQVSAKKKGKPKETH